MKHVVQLEMVLMFQCNLSDSFPRSACERVDLGHGARVHDVVNIRQAPRLIYAMNFGKRGVGKALKPCPTDKQAKVAEGLI